MFRVLVMFLCQPKNKKSMSSSNEQQRADDHNTLTNETNEVNTGLHDETVFTLDVLIFSVQA